jgi:hypothetical protein
MAEFPPDWEFFPEVDYASFHRAPPSSDEPGINLLVPVNRAGRASGPFRINIFAQHFFSVRFPLKQVMHNLPATLADVQAELVSSLDEITPPPNSTATVWDDAEDKYKKRSLILTKSDGTAFPEGDFLSYLRSPSSDKSCLGASFRWAVAGCPASAGMQLELQSLPCQARFLSKPNLRGDNAVSVLIRAFTLNADLFDGSSHAGPVPLLFSPDITATTAALAADPYIIHDDLVLIFNHFIHMEHLTLTDAVAYLQRGKARKATGSAAFSTASGSGSAPPSKRGRYSQFPAMDAGNILFRSHLFNQIYTFLCTIFYIKLCLQICIGAMTETYSLLS